MLIVNRRLKLFTRKVIHHAVDAVIKMPALTDFCFENGAAELILNHQRRHTALAACRAFFGPFGARMARPRLFEYVCDMFQFLRLL